MNDPNEGIETDNATFKNFNLFRFYRNEWPEWGDWDICLKVNTLWGFLYRNEWPEWGDWDKIISDGFPPDSLI